MEMPHFENSPNPVPDVELLCGGSAHWTANKLSAKSLAQRHAAPHNGADAPSNLCPSREIQKKKRILAFAAFLVLQKYKRIIMFCRCCCWLFFFSGQWIKNHPDKITFCNNFQFKKKKTLP